ncbi:chorismate synthase [Candidatus Liberibacter sp.]|uniref:chorismate synthase n=1 Tax=Candidatus Liberibacter sp. TaxID=34022 RepID=UPI0015F5D80F|nr:chorismate synthase [Candidatus Liberibacter sp.]MBA5724213.1 chorismate synthase [Candidatus Liberibacter sp.]
MSYNSFGHLFRVTTWGESHGISLGCLVDGCPPGIRFTLDEIQYRLDQRKPGNSRFVTQRKENDIVKILSGFLEEDNGKSLITIGTPIAMTIENIDQNSMDYKEISQKYRPGHADYTYDVKYGIRDPRGGGRSSARETVARVAAGALARKIIPNLSVRAALIQIGPHKINRSHWDWNEVNKNPFFSPDSQIVPLWEEYINTIRKKKSSIGAVIEVVAENVPAGLGAPVYGKLDQDIAALLMSINAVKGVEIGEGFQSVSMTGKENADCMKIDDHGFPCFFSNHAGGILGGISTGQPIIARFVVKPTSSIPVEQLSIDADGNETTILTKGRHDPCVGIRAVPIGEAMVACVLADHYLRDRGQIGKARYGKNDVT